jgi:hypothetical protein
MNDIPDYHLSDLYGKIGKENLWLTSYRQSAERYGNTYAGPRPPESPCRGSMNA